MYISYAISRFLFGFRIETLVIYEWLMYWLGLLCMYVLLSNLKLQHDTVWISLFAYSVPTIFFSHAYYYFTFNNFFFVPFLVWILFRTRGRRHMFVVPGIMLAFSLLMGHGQYTCYYIMTYCIIVFVFSFQDKCLKEAVSVLSNLAVFAFLSAVLMMLTVGISGNRSAILAGQPQEFMFLQINIRSVLLPICLIPWKGFSSISEMQQYVGLGAFALFGMSPFINVIVRKG